MVQRFRLVGLCALVAGALAIGGCPLGDGFDFGGDSGEDSVNEPGTVRMLITDKPFPVDLIKVAEVTVTEVRLRYAGDDDSDDEGDDEADDVDGEDAEDGDDEEDTGSTAKAQVRGQDTEEGEDDSGSDEADEDEAEEDEDAEDDEDGENTEWITVFEGETTFNLLNLRNGEIDVLAEQEVPSGEYSQMRLIVSGGRVVLTDDREFDLRVPSGAQSGIKLHFNFEVEAEGETELLVDFDLSKAFKPIPGGAVVNDVTEIENFMFRPSLAVRVVEVDETGTISGIATDDSDAPLANVLVTAYLGTEEITSTVTEDDGSYMILGLEPGTYDVEFSLAGYGDVVVSDVEVVAEEDTDLVDAELAAL